MNPFIARGIAFAMKTSAAAIAAMLVALWFNLPNPGWAAVTVFVTSQQQAGAAGVVIGRSGYRALGTLLGAAGTLFVVPAFASAPESLIAGVAAWVGLLVYIALLDRSPRSYVFLLAAYTLPLIGLPVANSPASAFDVALWRAEEIGLGAALSMTVHAVLAPRSVKPLLVAKVRATVDAAGRWMPTGSGPHPNDDAARRSRERLAVDVAEMRQLAAHLRFEPGITARDIATVDTLEARLLALLPLLAGAEERLAGMRTADAGTGQILAMGATQRLADLQDAWRQCLALLRRLEDETSVPAPGPHDVVVEAAQRALHVDHALAAFAGFGAAMAVVVAGTLCWAIGWDQGPATMGIAAASSSLSAFLDDPRPALRALLVAGVLAVPVAAFYAFAVLPALDGPAALALALAPLFFISALYLATPELGLPTMGFVLIALPLLSIQSVQASDFGSFTATAVGAVLGSSIALVVASLVRVVGAETSVRRLLHAASRDLAAMADDTRTLSRAAWTCLMLDRIGLMLPRLARTSGVLRARAERALDDLRMGVDVLDLRQAGLAAEPRVRTAIECALTQIAAHFGQRRERLDIAPAPAVLHSIDWAIAELHASDAGPLRVQGLTAATGLRLGLCPPSPIDIAANRASP